MFMPPIMGAGGFIMAEMTGLPYSHIMLVAIFPAVMYFFSVFVMVHFEAKKDNVVGERYKYSAMQIFKKEWLYTLPLIFITISCSRAILLAIRPLSASPPASGCRSRTRGRALIRPC